MAEPIRRGPLSNEIPRRNPSADNAIGTEDGDIGGNRGTNSRTRGSRLEGKAERGRDSFEARTRGNRTNFDATIENRFCCKLKKWLWIFFWRKAVVVIVVVIVVVLYVKRWSVFLEYLILCSFFLLFLFAICFLPEINGKLKIRGRKLKIFRYRLFF